MKPMLAQQEFSRIGAAVASICLSLAVPRFAAAASTFTIDSTLSTLNLSGSFSGFTLLPQGPGAMSDHFSGTIVADSSGGVLSFSGGSSITALINPGGPFQPMSGGADGSAPGNYGVQIPTVAEFGAYRGLVFDILSGSLMNGGVPVVTLAYAAGVLDYAGPATGPGQLTFAGLTGPDLTVLPASLTTAGGIETLTLPFTFSVNISGGPQQTFDGTIVASAPVPEPSPVVLGVVGGALLGAFCGLRHRLPKRGEQAT